MNDQLFQHLNQIISISEREYNEIKPYFETVPIKKKENLLTVGEVCKANYFVNKGCLRLYFINDKGTEQTIQFALENWWISDYASFSAKSPSAFNLQAVEDSELMVLNFKKQEELLQKFPQMEKYFRIIHQRAHAASQFRTKIFYSLSREELYHQFVTKYPHFVQRIPQYLLASFLGFTPEYLSEIRAKKRS